MKGFWVFLLALVWKILGWQVKTSKPTMQEGQGAGEEEKKLKEQIKKEGWDDEKSNITNPSSKS